MQVKTYKKNDMLKSVGVIELVSPKGHVTINNYFLSCIITHINTIYVGHSVASGYKDFEETKVFSDSLFLKGRIIHSIMACLYGLMLVSKLKIQNTKTVVFLSYDISCFFLISWYCKLLSLRVITFEHNTVPRSDRKGYLFHRLVSSSVVRLCFSKTSINEYKKLSKAAIFVEHPILENIFIEDDNEYQEIISYSSNYESTVFCPSASSNFDEIIDFAKKNPNFLVISKGKLEVKGVENLRCFPRFNCYKLLMKKSDFIFIPVDFYGRVSGPMYESLRYSKSVILLNNHYGRECKEAFGEHIILIDEPFIKSEKAFNYTSHNNGIEKVLRGLIIDE